MGLFSCCGRQKTTDGTRRVQSHPYTRDASSASPFETNRISNTKYTLWNFVPLNLWQQCGQAMNRYFLLIACLQLWSAITPVAPVTTWGPLLVIFAISGLKEAIDDTRRYRNDNLANERLVTVLRDGRRQQIQSQNLLVGDVVYITEDEEFPADLLLLRSSETKTGSCYIQTSNIDGETNLKQRVAAHKDYTQLLEESQMFQLDVVVECAQPNHNIYNFDSTLKLPRDWKQQVAKRSGAAGGASSSSSSGSSNFPSQVETAFPLSSNNLLLQATYLRNTTWIYGLVVYAGNSSKVGCNKSPPQQKYTKVDETINQVTVVVFLMQLSMIVTWGLLGSHQEALHMTQSTVDGENGGWWYLVYEDQPTNWVTPLIIPLRFLLLASMMIPISLKVSLDLIKLYYSMCINWDLQLYDERTDEPAKATNTSIAENLGQVAYVLSDKTGTLTENVMVFRKLAVADGKRYGENEPSGGAVGKDSRRSSSGAKTPRAGVSSPVAETGGILSDPALLADLDCHSAPLIGLLRFMALCNTVVPSWIGGKPSHLRAAAYSDASSTGLLTAGSSLLSPASSGPDGTKALSLEMAVSLPTQNGVGSIQAKEEEDAAVWARKQSDDAEVAPQSKKSKKAKAKDAAKRKNSKQVALLDEDELESDSVAVHPAAELNRGASITSVGVTPTGSYQGDKSYLDRPVSYTPSSIQRQPSTSVVAKGRRPSLAKAVSSTTSGSGNVGNIHYASSSPDELSLVEFAASVGVRLLEKEGSVMRLHVEPRVVNGGDELDSEADRTPVRVTEEWEVLHILEFSSERKRMSVVLRQMSSEEGGTGKPGKGQVWLYTKGADDVMFARVKQDAAAASSSTASSSSASSSQFRSILDSYACAGLRTLCFGARAVPEKEYHDWAEKLHAANLDIHAREAKLSEAYELLERDLTLLGCSGIEDKLQWRVPETIEELRQAGIKIWMLTGDRWATALEISKSCALYKPRAAGSEAGDVLLAIEGATQEDVRRSLDAALQQAFLASSVPSAYCLIIDGTHTPWLLSPDLAPRFALLALRAVSVICARTTPSQKAGMVQLVKQYSLPLGSITSDDVHRIIHGGEWTSQSESIFSIFTSFFKPSGQVVLAIGDGGNDVSMLQASDVGVGIVGKEGLQASRAADYSFARFECLTRLLLVHGRYAYGRTAFVAQYCFFKSMLICLVQLFYAFATNWSGASYFDSYSLVTYNLFYTSLPTLLFVFEQDLSPAMLRANPQLYRTSQRGENLTVKTLLGWLARAVLQAIFLISYALHTYHGEPGSMAFGAEGQISNALVIYTACVLIHPLTIYLESTYITRVHHVLLGGTVVLFLVLNCLLAVLSPHMDLWRVYLVLLTDGEYYLRVLLVTVSCMVPVLAFKYLQTRYYPSVVQIAHEKEVTTQTGPSDGWSESSGVNDYASPYHLAP